MLWNSVGNKAVLEEIIEFDKQYGKKNTIDDKDDKGNTPLILGKAWIHNNMEIESQFQCFKLFILYKICKWKNVNIMVHNANNRFEWYIIK